MIRGFVKERLREIMWMDLVDWAQSVGTLSGGDFTELGGRGDLLVFVSPLSQQPGTCSMGS